MVNSTRARGPASTRVEARDDGRSRAAAAADYSPRSQSLASLAQLVRQRSDPVQRRVMTFANERADPEVDYSASIIAKAEQLPRTEYDPAADFRSTEKEVFVGHSTGTTLDSEEPGPFADRMTPRMDKSRHYEFVIAACKTGQSANGFASGLNSQLMGRGMSQTITAPKNALTVVNANTYLQAEGLDPWQHPNFGDYFKAAWLVVLKEVFVASTRDFCARCKHPDNKRTDQTAAFKDPAILRLDALFSENDSFKGATKGFEKPPQGYAAIRLFELGTKLERVVAVSQAMNDERRLEGRVRTWLNVRATSTTDEYLALLVRERERITTAALRNFTDKLSPEDKPKVKAFAKLGGKEPDWYSELKIGLD
jgi:hypothetical protein